MAETIFDIAFLGHYSYDTVISALGTRHLDGGTAIYGAYVAARMGLKTAWITRIADDDIYVVHDAEKFGIQVFATPSPQSTCMHIEYPNINVDVRVIQATSIATSFTPDDVAAISARAFSIGAMIRSEVPCEVIETIKKKKTLLAANLQGFLRTVRNDNILIYSPWPEKERILPLIDILQTDAMEAEFLTGEKDVEKAAKIIAGFGPKEVLLSHRNELLVYDGTDFYHVPFHGKELIGRTGRGSTLIAAYLSKRLSAPVAEAAVWAGALTSLKMERDGIFSHDIHEVEALIRDQYRNK